MLTDGKCLCEEKGWGSIRVGEEDLPSAWSVSRKDVAWFIANKAMKEWKDWSGKAVTITN